MRYKKTFVAVIAAGVLSACSTADFRALDQTQYSGQNVVEAEFQVPKDEAGVKSFKATFAKDCKACTLKVTAGDGRMIEFDGTGIQGTEHIKALGETLRHLSTDNNETVRSIAPDVVKTLGDVFTGSAR